MKFKEQFLQKYAEAFTGVGKMSGKHHITLDESVTPVINPPRLVPQSLHMKLKETLDKLEGSGIISKVNKPTNWVNNLVIIEKPNKELRLCLDPKDLNAAIRREIHRIPTPETIIANLSGKKVFSVFDMRQGFWQIELDEDSAEYCTFNTPFTRYKFNRLPFGLSSAPEVFQKKNEELFGDIPGVYIYFDDIFVCGDSESEHDRNVKKLMNRAIKNNVKFNLDKIQYRVSKINYCGHIISNNNVMMDTKYIQAVTDLEMPKNRKQLLGFLGFMKYLNKFIPNLSLITAPLRELTKDNVQFQWHPIHTEAVNKLKSIVTNSPVLKIFNPTEQLVIQTDASKDGLGACLLQNSQPIAFTSRALTASEQL